MPCYTTTTVSVEVGKWDAARAQQAIEAAGLKFAAKYVNGKIVINENQNNDQTINSVKKHYAALTLKAASKKFGWSIKSESQTTTGLLKINLTRR